MKRFARFGGVALVLAGTLGAASPARAISFAGLYSAENANGNVAPPTYILRLDGVFGGGDATFNEQGVSFEIFADGSAQMSGLVAVGAPGAPDPAFGTIWDLETSWDAAGMSSDQQFFSLSSGILRNQADPMNDFILLEARGMDAHAGTGIFPDGKCVSTAGNAPCFGFAGWVSYAHHIGDDVILWEAGDTADFIMELQPVGVPEPHAGLLLLGAVASAWSWRRRR